MKYAIVDLESTGPRLDKGDRIIQIGTVIFEQGKLVGQYEMLINPDCEIPQNIQQLTGICQKEVDQAPHFASVANLWLNRLEDCLFIAHNLNHDLTFMQHHFRECGIEFDPLAIDSVKLAKIIFPQALGFNLTDLSCYLNLAFNNAHQALADAQITGKILHLMANKLMSLPKATQAKLLALAKELDHQEEIFFKQPELFRSVDQIDQADPIKSQMNLPIQAQPKMNAQIDWLIEKTLDTDRLVIEGQWRPINSQLIKKWLAALSQSQNVSIVLAISSQSALEEWAKFLDQAQISYSFLLRPSQYLHLDHFKHYLDQLVITHLNQQELIVIGSTLVWLEETQTGLLMEMNHEMKIYDQMKRFYQGLLPSRTTSYFYQKALNHHHDQPLVLTQTTYLMEEVSHAHVFQKQAVLVCDNLSLLARHLSFFHQVRLEYSQFLILCQQVLDIFYHQDRAIASIQAAIMRLEHLINLTRQLLNILEAEIRQRQFEPVDGESRREVKVPSQTIQAIQTVHQQLQKGLKHLINDEDLEELLSIHPNHLQVKMTKMKYFLMHLDNIQAQLTQDNGYLIIRVSQIEDRYYQFELIWKPIRLEQEYQSAFDRFEQIILFSPGDFHFRLKSGTYYQLGLTDYSYLHLPQHIEKSEVIVPFTWIAKESRADKRVNEQAKLLGEFLQERIREESLPPLSLIIVNNRQQAIDSYRQLKSKLADQDQVRILAQHVSGSLNKIRRLAMDGIPTILVIQWQSLLNENWTLDQRACQIFWTRLPFRSLKDSYILALANHLAIEEDLIFDHLLVERMVVDFSIAFDYIDRHFNSQAFYLLDDRVFTKYYSKEIRQKLEHLIEFNLQ
ncbi:exonuclease domain-containing protein [Facklamia miroungae]|uniref:DNA polymerase III polC-type n=1 Tax=Facklamia miroungae TaxID=120956 RepID=A0A1G7PKL6_9LACT|nr:exonuclease domain-containing protein [Facklamia miroungae]NKZ28748.1 hypothetical protein [Facklamia miroungae]SDF86758.1 exonuclease, DNA polymerase III, epsilon subunit family [Facklamia miroungae]